MKKLLFISLCIAGLILSCTQEKKSPVEGAWQLVSANYVTQDTIVNFPVSAYGNHMKIIGERYFSTIWQDTSISKSDTWYGGFNGGTYTFDNEVYTESLSYLNSLSGIGSTWSSRVEFKGDTMVLTYIPEDPDSNVTAIEKWKRLE